MRHSMAPRTWRAMAACLVAGIVLAVPDTVLAARVATVPPSAASSASAPATKTLEQEVADMERKQQELLDQTRRDIAAMPMLDPAKPDPTAAERAAEDKRLQMIRKLAAIEETINEQNARPRRRYFAGRAVDPVFAEYYRTVANCIEYRGTSGFPVSDGRKLYGGLTMNILIDANGQLVDTQVVRSSGNRILDRKAQAIARASAPFRPFTEAMRAATDQIVLTERFKFTRDLAEAPAASRPSAADCLGP